MKATSTLAGLLSALHQAMRDGANPDSPVVIHDAQYDAYYVMAGVHLPEPTLDGTGYVWFTLEPGFEADGRTLKYAYDD
jgi:hypothetical protein